MVTELLDCGVDVDATADNSVMSTMLQISSAAKQLDLIRFLLQRGASADLEHSMGCVPSALCWLISDIKTKHTSMDVYNVLSESTYIDLRYDKHDLAVAVTFVATYVCASQIDSLIRFGFDNYQGMLDPCVTLALAATCGNSDTYSALVSRFGPEVFAYDDIASSFLLKITILGKYLCWARDPNLVSAHDEILRDLLQRCGDDRLWPLPALLDRDPRLSAILSEKMKASELAAALSPEIEAWYLDTVRTCGFLDIDEENEVMQRLRELTFAGYVTAGLVYKGEEECDKSGVYTGCGSEGWNEESSFAKGSSTKDTDTSVSGEYQSSTESEIDEADQFWDASEGI